MERFDYYDWDEEEDLYDCHEIDYYDENFYHIRYEVCSMEVLERIEKKKGEKG